MTYPSRICLQNFVYKMFTNSNPKF